MSFWSKDIITQDYIIIASFTTIYDNVYVFTNSDLLLVPISTLINFDDGNHKTVTDRTVVGDAAWKRKTNSLQTMTNT